MEKFKKYIPWLIVLFFILFIFANSLTSVDTSKQVSSSITNQLMSVFGTLTTNIDFNKFHHFIRKFAHFSEYAILGILICIAIKKAPLLKSPILTYCCFLFIPILDENLQRLSPGRSCEFGDMLIDISGMLFGLLLFLLFIKIWSARKKTNHTCY